MEPKSSLLGDVFLAFVTNLGRTAVFGFLPAKLAYSGHRDQLWNDCAEVEVTGKLDPNLLKFWGSPPPGLLEIAARLSKEFHASHSEIEVKTAATAFGVKLIERLLSSGHRGAQESMVALFASLILAHWTTFECLASDLWTIGVDKGPKEIAQRISVSGHLLRPTDNITPETVHNLEFDPRADLGSFLRETGRVSFQKLDQIRLYYAEAFGTEIKALFDQTCDGYIFALSAYRNALIHNAGKADKKFIKRVERFPELRGITLGSQLELDGVLVLKLNNAAAQLGAALLQFVDNVLTNPPNQ